MAAASGGVKPGAPAAPSLVETLAVRERFRDRYLNERDPIAADRLLWRAQTFRHLGHLLPGQSVLELGCGEGRLTRALATVSRGENPITAVTFDPGNPPGEDAAHPAVERVFAADLPGPLEGRSFDRIVAMDMLDRRNSAWLLRQVHELLRPAGEVVFFESNPWNPVLRLRNRVGVLRSRRDPRVLLSRTQLYELMSDVGFVRVFAVPNDFVYAPLTPRMAWFLRNLSTLLENAPGSRLLAGSILVHGQKPPRQIRPPAVSLTEHDSLRRAISVVIPCHNEEMNIEPLVERFRELYGDYLHEIIPVDDNSSDGTAAVLRRLAAEDDRIRPIFRTPPNGVGLALADGYRAATGRYVLSMDSDFQHLLPEFRDLFDAAARGFDVVVGSRFSRHSVLLNYPFRKIVANRGFHLLARLVLPVGFRDVTNNLKLMRRSVVEELRLVEPGFAVNAETGLQPLLMGFSVKEVPISWINRTPEMGSSSFRLVRVGGGYWRVLGRSWQRLVFGTGAYRDLRLGSRPRRTDYLPPAGAPPVDAPSNGNSGRG